MLLLLFSLWSGSLFADWTSYRQGVGTSTVFPDIFPKNITVQVGGRNLYSIAGSYIFSGSYNRKEFTIASDYINLSSYYSGVKLDFALRHNINLINTGICFSFARELKPISRNIMVFGMATGAKVQKHISIHTSVTGIGENTHLSVMGNVYSTFGSTLILLEGEKYTPLKLFLSQAFIVNKKLTLLVFFGTSPYKIGLTLRASIKNITLDAFSEIHDVLGTSGGAIVEYAPSKSYN